MKYIALLCILTFFFTQTVFAIECLSNAKQVALGDSAKQVLAVCGSADKTIEKTVSTPKSRPISKWFYLAQFDDKLSAEASTKSLIKIVIQFYQEQVDHIQVLVPANTQEDHEALNMLGYLITKGDKAKRVESILGKPQTIKNTTETFTEKTTVVDQLLYNDSDSSRQQQFIFQDEKLAQANYINTESTKGTPIQTEKTV